MSFMPVVEEIRETLSKIYAHFFRMFLDFKFLCQKRPISDLQLKD